LTITAEVTRRLGTEGKLRLPPGVLGDFDPERPPIATDRRVKVLFIVSAGRSGSTLIDLLLGQTEQITAVGELYAIWEVGVQENVGCGCGHRFHDCPLWSAVFRRSFGGMEDIDADAMVLFWQRNGQMFGDHMRRLAFAGSRRDIGTMSDCTPILESIYQSVAAETDAELIVDTSKSVFHAEFLRNSKVIDPYVLHLVRDPRGVVFSWTRPKVELGYDGGERMMPAKTLNFSTVWWIIINHYAAMMKKDFPGRYQLLRYEDFVARPEEEFRRIGAFCGLDVDPAQVFAEAADAIEPTHSVWGNPMRFDKQVKIRSDERWREGLSPHERRLITAYTLPWLPKYSYRP
jgi:hypothetical protein